MNLFDSPVILNPCGHVMCKKCQVETKKSCAQCSREAKSVIQSDLIKDMANKFAVTKDALETFKNQAFWKNRLNNMKKNL